ADDDDLLSAWTGLARSLAAEGDAGAADAEWKAVVASLPSSSSLPRARSDWVLTAYARYLVSADRLDDAQAILQPEVQAAWKAAREGNRDRFLASAGRLQLLFWIAVHEGDRARAEHWLMAWKESMRASMRKNNVQLVFAQLALA